MYLIIYFERDTKGCVTMAAVKEAREDKNLETINLDNLEEFIESL